MRQPILRTWLILAVCASAVSAQSVRAPVQDLLLRGGMLFDAVGNEAVRNPGILIRAGKILQIGAGVDAPNARLIQLADDAFVLPGFFDLHAHYAVDFFGGGR